MDIDILLMILRGKFSMLSRKKTATPNHALQWNRTTRRFLGRS